MTYNQNLLTRCLEHLERQQETEDDMFLKQLIEDVTEEIASVPREIETSGARLFCMEGSGKGLSMNSPAMVAASCGDIRNIDQEVVLIIGYSNKNKEIFRELAFKGCLDMCHCDPKIIFRHLILKSCTSFIMVHNHQSGDTTPSKQDTDMARRLKDGGALIDIRLQDAIIVGGDDDFYSFGHAGTI